MTEVAEKLREARALIERGWTQGEFARGVDGAFASPLTHCATSFCAYGALMRVHGRYPSSFAEMPGVKELTTALRGEYIEEFNDDPERTQADVLAAFDKAIALAEAEQ